MSKKAKTFIAAVLIATLAGTAALYEGILRKIKTTKQTANLVQQYKTDILLLIENIRLIKDHAWLLIDNADDLTKKGKNKEALQELKEAKKQIEEVKAANESLFKLINENNEQLHEKLQTENEFIRKLGNLPEIQEIQKNLTLAENQQQKFLQEINTRQIEIDKKITRLEAAIKEDVRWGLHGKD
jgi:tetratricopeptide (TPR) repeat protein